MSIALKVIVRQSVMSNYVEKRKRGLDEDRGWIDSLLVRLGSSTPFEFSIHQSLEECAARLKSKEQAELSHQVLTGNTEIDIWPDSAMTYQFRIRRRQGGLNVASGYFRRISTQNTLVAGEVKTSNYVYLRAFIAIALLAAIAFVFFGLIHLLACAPVVLTILGCMLLADLHICRLRRRSIIDFIEHALRYVPYRKKNKHAAKIEIQG
jgi:hypothetical protein